MKTLFTYISVLLTVVSYCPLAISSPAHNVPLPQCAKDAAREAGAEQRLFEAVIAYEFGIKTDRVPCDFYRVSAERLALLVDQSSGDRWKAVAQWLGKPEGSVTVLKVRSLFESGDEIYRE
ncbi:hypothetical protein [Pseudomonas aeruginosa]|uniref:hypothetical protein n=1 Tax=Pseudomonas aeruginosa TaxID=287 RepID=UPI0003BAE7D8|nr:hypothetical protein [Pseudomonas aeruginosa]ERW61357.1 hypothetical protein Q024_06404 [Pseudomonas aeruginosa BWHPSA011]MCW4649277.1 hypothetical protein [Pseudomonas aeruginosa]RUC23214.1 hypothetical protein IPC1405_26580 [Pseudomonas aeruginosa]